MINQFSNEQIAITNLNKKFNPSSLKTDKRAVMSAASTKNKSLHILRKSLASSQKHLQNFVVGLESIRLNKSSVEEEDNLRSKMGSKKYTPLHQKPFKSKLQHRGCKQIKKQLKMRAKQVKYQNYNNNQTQQIKKPIKKRIKSKQLENYQQFLKRKHLEFIVKSVQTNEKSKKSSTLQQFYNPVPSFCQTKFSSFHELKKENIKQRKNWKNSAYTGKKLVTQPGQRRLEYKNRSLKQLIQFEPEQEQRGRNYLSLRVYYNFLDVKKSSKQTGEV